MKITVVCGRTSLTCLKRKWKQTTKLKLMELHFFHYLLSLQPSFSPCFSSLPPIPTKKRGKRKNLRNNTGKAALGGRGDIVSYRYWLFAQIGSVLLTYWSCVLGLPLSVYRGHAGILGPGTRFWLLGIYCSLLQNGMSRSPDQIFQGEPTLQVVLNCFWSLVCLAWGYINRFGLRKGFFLYQVTGEFRRVFAGPVS